MKTTKSALYMLVCLLFLPFAGKAQVEASLKARLTGFHGTYGKTFAAIGYEPAVTLQPGRFWSGGISFSQNLLAIEAEGASPDLTADMSLINFHIGAKRTVGTYFHPFMYAMAGFRFTDYKSDLLVEESNPALGSVTIGYGIKSGLQIGKGKWRFEGSLELMSGTKARYLTPDSFERAYNAGGDYRDYAAKSRMTSLTAAVGIAWVLDWDEVEYE